MSQQVIAVGTVANDGTGDPARTAFQKCNSNFTELYASDAAKAPLASPTFTGTPAAPTATGGTNTTQLATTAFVQAAIALLVNSSPSTLDTLKELADALGDDPNFATTVTNALAAKAPLNSPALVTPDLGTPSAANLSNATADGTNPVGFRNVPGNSQSAAYTCVLSDAGKAIDHPATDANARTYTIPANSSVAYPVGTCITFTNMTTQPVTIAITTDTMYLAGAGTTGSRTLAQYGVATARKLTATTWLISGVNLT